MRHGPETAGAVEVAPARGQLLRERLACRWYGVAMSGGEGFGPVGPVAAEGPPFSVAGPSTVSLDGARSGSGSFTVSNVTGRPVRARLLVLPGAGADAAWFQVVGESERLLPVAGTATVDVSVRVAEQAPAGAFSFSVGAALEEAPDRVVSGPTVAFQVAEPAKRKFPWWIVIVAAAALLLLIGGGLAIWFLTRPDPTPAPAAIVVSVDGLELVDEQGTVLGSAEFADGAGVVEFLGDAVGSTPEGEENTEGYPITSYDWGEVTLRVVDDGAASIVASSATIEGLEIRTTEGVGVGSSREAAVDAGAEEVFYADGSLQPDLLRLQVRDAPGTDSLENPGTTGVDFVLLVLEGGDVVRIFSPSSDYGDL